MGHVLAFVGYHNSGKTTLIRKVAVELRKRGYLIGIIKSTKHDLEPFEKEGSDTDLYRGDGIEYLAVVTPTTVTAIMPHDDRGLEVLALSLFPDVDLVICEGFKHANDIKKIEVARSDISTQLIKDNTSGVVAVVSDFDVKGVRHFSHKDITGLCDFIEDTYQLPQKKKMDEIALVVNGRKIPLKRFVRDSMKGTICGYVSSLRFTKGAREIQIFIKMKKNR